jgi:hypothetical protein
MIAPVEVHINEDQVVFGNWHQILRKIPSQDHSFPMLVLTLPHLPLKHFLYLDSHPAMLSWGNSALDVVWWGPSDPIRMHKSVFQFSLPTSALRLRTRWATVCRSGKLLHRVK